MSVYILTTIILLVVSIIQTFRALIMSYKMAKAEKRIEELNCKSKKLDEVKDIIEYYYEDLGPFDLRAQFNEATDTIQKIEKTLRK